MQAEPMQDAERTAQLLRAELERLAIPARPIVVPTPWDVGPVTAYLFPSDPVTMIDAAINTDESRAVLREGLAAEGLHPRDVCRIIVTHAHLDHFGGAVWLQKESGCEVLLHEADMAIADVSAWGESTRELFGPLGFTPAQAEAFYAGEPSLDLASPRFTAVPDGAVFETGTSKLRVDLHPGHSPGHVWVTDCATGAIFVGDYVIADHPTNAGMEIDRTQASGRAPLLTAYNTGLRELRDRSAPALFPGHGPPIVDKAALIDRRLAKSDRRTRHVLDGLTKLPNATALEIGRALYGSRPEHSWEVVADLVGRLDLLVAEGRASARMGEDGAWHFTATT